VRGGRGKTFPLAAISENVSKQENLPKRKGETAVKAGIFTPVARKGYEEMG